MTYQLPAQDSLSPQRAFVVQFRTNADLARGHAHGRVEHVVSGRALIFTSFDELAAFLTQIVTDLQHSDTEETACDQAPESRRV